MTPRRSRGRRGPARCRGCDAPVTFFFSPFTTSLRPFDPDPVEPTHLLAGITAFPVLGRTAYKPHDLTEHLLVTRGGDFNEIAAEVADMPWHKFHECPPDTKDTP